MPRRLHLLLLLLTCLCVGAEVLLATASLPAMRADQVHDCGSTDARLTAEIEGGETELEPPAPIADPARAGAGLANRARSRVLAGRLSSAGRARGLGVRVAAAAVEPAQFHPANGKRAQRSALRQLEPLADLQLVDIDGLWDDANFTGDPARVAAGSRDAPLPLRYTPIRHAW
jgi:hypothetical protein